MASESTPRDRAAEVLAAHQPSHIVNSREGTYVCLCDAAVPVPGGFDRDAFAIDWEARAIAVCTHQAEMLVAAGLLPDREEWGVQFERTADPTMDNPSGVITVEQTVRDEQIARASVKNGAPISARNRRVIHRYTTEWRTA